MTVAKQRIAKLGYWRLISRGSAGSEEAFLIGMRARFGSATKLIPIGRARGGIYLLVKNSISGNRRKVIMSPYTIPDIVNMVILAGGDPVFYDFYPNSTSCDVEALSELIDESVSCVMVTHYHVNEPRIIDIVNLCRRQGVKIFDDCAIAFGGSVGGAPIGTLTDASVFSFSSFKFLNFFWGGMIATQDVGLANELNEFVSSWPRLTSRDYLRPAKAVLPYDLASSPPAFDALTFPLLRRRAAGTGDAEGLQFVRIETEVLEDSLTARPSLAAFSEWAAKLHLVDDQLGRRRAIAKAYRDQLGPLMVSAPIPESQLEGACFVNFPVLAPADRRDQVVRDMMVAGYDVGRSLYANAHAHPKFRGFPGNSEQVAALAAKVIYLPTHFGVTETYAQAAGQKLAELLR